MAPYLFRMFSRTLCLLVCCGLPFAAQAGLDSHSGEVAGWLLQALLVVVGGAILLFCAAFASGFLVWPRFSTTTGKIAVLLLVGCFAFVCGVLALLFMLR